MVCRGSAGRFKLLVVCGAFVAAAVTLAACGGPTVGNSPYGNGSKIQVNSGPSYEVTTRTISGLGRVLTNGQGFTLYLFQPDDHSSVSHCNGACATAWPPLLLPSGVAAPVAGSGVNSSLLGTTVRRDGSTQITYNGWPLYRWVDDVNPGLATGQGLYNLGGRWYTVSPDGDPDQGPNPSGFS